MGFIRLEAGCLYVIEDENEVNQTIIRYSRDDTMRG